ncbi:hypothetical protein O9992_00700 [Vibrio lentus]|nr:hypothetical protein [Vibrio lentus]
MLSTEIGVFYAMQSLLNVYDPFSRYTISNHEGGRRTKVLNIEVSWWMSAVASTLKTRYSKPLNKWPPLR